MRFNGCQIYETWLYLAQLYMAKVGLLRDRQISFVLHFYIVVAWELLFLRNEFYLSCLAISKMQMSCVKRFRLFQKKFNSRVKEQFINKVQSF